MKNYTLLLLLAFACFGLKAQNVGIGNSNPNMRLTIQPIGGGQDLVQFRDQAGTNQWFLKTASGGADLVFAETGGADNVLVMGSGGNVGIGIAAPTHKLHVNGGNIGLEGSRAMVIGGNNTNTPDTSPDAQLVLDGAHNGPFQNTKLLIRGGNNDSAPGKYSINVVDENNHQLFYIDGYPEGRGTNYFRANTGIGITNPEAYLDIVGPTAIGSLTTYGDNNPALIVEQRHGPTVDILGDGGDEWFGPTIDLRSFNGTNYWSTAKIVGLVDYGGVNHAGGLAIMVQNGGDANPSGSRLTKGGNYNYGMAIEGNGVANFPNGLRTQRRYRKFNKRTYSRAFQSTQHNLGAWDICYLSGFRKETGEDVFDGGGDGHRDYIHCEVQLDNDNFLGFNNSISGNIDKTFAQKPNWELVTQAKGDGSGSAGDTGTSSTDLSCQAICVNFDF